MLGWSVTRYDIFTSCKRLYYYQYYGNYDHEHSRYEINKLKKLTSIPLEIGNIVHDILKTFLERLQRSSKPIDQNRFFEFSQQLTQNYANAKTFFETYYGDYKSIKSLEQLYPKIEQCLTNFLESGRSEWLLTRPIKEKSKWVIEPPGYGKTTINGYKAYCKVDFLFPNGKNLQIMDWKTGQPYFEKHKKQLTAYSYWASDKFNHDPAMINCSSAYLFPEYHEMDMRLSHEDILAFSKIVQNETFQMWEYCIDVEQNLPKPKNAFPMTVSINKCNTCNFKQLCRR